MSEFQWSPGMLSNSYYKDVSALPVGGPPVISLASSSKSKYIIPEGVYNPSRNHIDFMFGIGTAAALKHNLHLGKIMPIQQMTWKCPSSGQVLANCEYIAQQTSVVLPNLKKDEYSSRTLTCVRSVNAATGAAVASANIDTCPFGEIIHPINKPSFMFSGSADFKDATGEQRVGYGAAPFIASDLLSASDGGLSLFPDLAGTATTPGVSSSGQNAPATIIGGTHQADLLYCKMRVNWCDLIDTLFAYDKDVYFPATELEITWRDGASWGFETTGIVTNTTSAAAANMSLAGSVPLSVVPVLNTTYPPVVYVARQANGKVAENVKLVWSSPDFAMLVPELTCSSNSLQASATQQTVSVPIPAGSRLLRCWVVTTNPNSGSVYLSSNNLDKQVGTATNNAPCVLYNNIRTAINSTYIQDNKLNVARGEDYGWLRDKLRGSAVMDWDTFRQFSFYVDNFTSGSRSVDWREENKDLGGLDTGNGFMYKVELTLQNAAAVTCNVLYVLQKTLKMTSSGPVIV